MTDHIAFTEKSRNEKVGETLVTTSSRKTCPDTCPLKAGGCYAAHSHLGAMWTKITNAAPDATHIDHGKGKVALRSEADLVEAIKRVPAGQAWRLNQAGDLPRQKSRANHIGRRALMRIAHANRDAGALGFTFTHYPVTGGDAAAAHNREAITEAIAAGFAINLSADNLDDADKKANLAFAPVAVVLPADQSENTTTPAGRRVVVCPATQRDDVQCVSCRLCARINRNVIVGFPAHGAGKAKAETIARGNAS